MLRKITLSFFVILTTLASFSHAKALVLIENEDAFHEPVRAELIVEEESIQANRPFWVGIRLKLDEHWHAYWKNPGDAGMAPVIQWNLPEGFEAGPLQWPTPNKFSVNSAVSFGYQDEVVLLAEVTPPAKIKDSVKLEADIKWVACDNASCLPGGAEIAITLPKS
ncbi:MAG: protein-disulfide reductase DsbD domain-containing protein, partial [Waddliaceae bacterium]